MSGRFERDCARGIAEIEQLMQALKDGDEHAVNFAREILLDLVKTSTPAQLFALMTPVKILFQMGMNGDLKVEGS